jgi:hypothetical protein
MLLLIDVFSINKGRGYENPILEIIVTEHYSTGGCPLEEAHEHFFLNQIAISVVVLISFLCYCGDYVGYITIILQFLAFFFVLHIYYIWYLASGIRALSLVEIVGIFFRVETYSGVFKPHRSVVMRINP